MQIQDYAKSPLSKARLLLLLTCVKLVQMTPSHLLPPHTTSLSPPSQNLAAPAWMLYGNGFSVVDAGPPQPKISLKCSV